MEESDFYDILVDQIQSSMELFKIPNSQEWSDYMSTKQDSCFMIIYDFFNKTNPDMIPEFPEVAFEEYTNSIKQTDQSKRRGRGRPELVNKSQKFQSFKTINDNMIKQEKLSMSKIKQTLIELNANYYYRKQLESINNSTNHIIYWDKLFIKFYRSIQSQVKQKSAANYQRILITGSQGSGKTALAEKLAADSLAVDVQNLSYADMIGYTDPKISKIIRKMFYESYKSPYGCIIVDDVEEFLVNPVISDTFIQLMMCPPPPITGNKLLIICTTGGNSDDDLINKFKQTIDSFIDQTYVVPNITKVDEIINVLIYLLITNNTKTNGNDTDDDNNNDDDNKRCFEIELIDELLDSYETIEPFSIGIKKLLFKIDWARQLDPLTGAKQFIADLVKVG
ncbi:vesicle-fusing ATPase 1-like [Oppia nitens]|uniref:vesicle-fusing ATPase 1-like n=1 Tax=Oppia nitens TaxID=1686743 RepID=UPI0023D99192|nr:vesicle-fusing ATPase 1-like [Oppia nitens]